MRDSGDADNPEAMPDYSGCTMEVHACERLSGMAEKLPNARLEVFPYVGHSMNLEQPLLFARVFGDYFRG